jgi:hypothetical protein
MKQAIEFVTFHADRHTSDAGPHPNANLEPSLYMQMIDLMFRSARIFHRNASCTLITDEATTTGGLHGDIHRFDFPIDHNALMYSRSLSQLAYIEQHSFTGPLALIDSDILINGGLSCVFDEDFDIAVTWRKSATMPINGGLLIVNNLCPDNGRHFFRRFLDVYRERYLRSSAAAWYGDQLALRDLIGLTHREMNNQRIVTIEGCRVLFLPCNKYNYSPENRYEAIGTGLKDHSIIHFKGPRKRLMNLFWNAFLLRQENSSLKNFFLSKLAVARLNHLSLTEKQHPTLAPEEEE